MISLETARNILKQLPADLIQRFRAVEVIIFDFDGVFTDNAVWVLEDGREMVRCTRADGIGLSKLPGIGVRPFVLSTEINPVVAARCRKLALPYLQNCPDKASALTDLAQNKLNVTVDQVAFVGNDTNDSGALQLAGLPIVVADAHPDVLAFAKYQTQTRGGYGAVREICDLLVAAKSL